MPYDPLKHNRRSIRLPGYDYTQPGAYFVTLVTKFRECLFGEILNGGMILNECGSIIRSKGLELPNRFPNIVLDEFVIMPNHIHGIIIISDGNGTVGAGSPRPVSPENNPPRPESSDIETSCPQSPRPESADDGSSGARGPRPYETANPTLGQIVAFYKYQSTKRINLIRGTTGAPVWQRNYWEHIIRDEDELSRIREYIRNNPARWATDMENDARHL
jgi:putative transposase